MRHLRTPQILTLFTHIICYSLKNRLYYNLYKTESVSTFVIELDFNIFYSYDNDEYYIRAKFSHGHIMGGTDIATSCH